ncbi:unnamed protein product [Effrenium voratum]|uniref:Uncharacterized protein n=1 Tax=Effrenium voratum TaxID=2562239 RepID=A0AA36IXI9_9DINO|nr:unnamed protein product [Effrenium voratum]
MSRRRRAAGDGPAVTLPTLVDGSSCSELNFTAAFENLESYLCFAVHGDRSEELGCAIGRVLSRYEKDSDGAYLQLAYEGCDDEYYRWYIQNEGKQGGLPKDCLHHLCRRHVSRCGRAHRQPHVVHIQKWCPVTRQEAHDILRGWGLPGLRAEPAQSTHALQTTPKSRAQKPAAMQSLPAPKAEDEELEVDWGDEEELPPLKRSRKQAAKARDGRGAADTAGAGEPGLSGKKVEDRLELLRAQLQGKQAETKTGKSTGAVLAARAVEASQKPRKKKKAGEDVLRQLKQALGPGGGRGSRDKEDSDDETEDVEDDGQEDESSLTGWPSRRRKLRKLAEEKPGKLLLTTLKSLHAR